MQVATANEAQQEGQAKKVEAESMRQRAYALFEAASEAGPEEFTKKLDEAEGVWAGALVAEQEAEARLVQAGQELESALTLDPAKTAIREAIGDVTVERLALSEAFSLVERQVDLRLRLSAYDPDGSRQKRGWRRRR